MYCARASHQFPKTPWQPARHSTWLTCWTCPPHIAHRRVPSSMRCAASSECAAQRDRSPTAEDPARPEQVPEWSNDLITRRNTFPPPPSTYRWRGPGHRQGQGELLLSVVQMATGRRQGRRRRGDLWERQGSGRTARSSPRTVVPTHRGAVPRTHRRYPRITVLHFSRIEYSTGQGFLYFILFVVSYRASSALLRIILGWRPMNLEGETKSFVTVESLKEETRTWTVASAECGISSSTLTDSRRCCAI